MQKSCHRCRVYHLARAAESPLCVHSLEACQVTVRTCVAAQTPTHMLGYIQKDRLRRHYDVSTSVLELMC